MAYHAGEVIELGGTAFVVLDDDYKSSADLFILTVDTQGMCKFGNHVYGWSTLDRMVREWRQDLSRRLSTWNTNDPLSEAAPLTLEEVQEYARFIPPCDTPWWLAGGSSCADDFDYRHPLFIHPDGSWDYAEKGLECGIRPALVIAPAVVEAERVIYPF